MTVKIQDVVFVFQELDMFKYTEQDTSRQFEDWVNTAFQKPPYKGL